MDFKDFINNKFDDQDPSDLKILIEFLEKNENMEKLLQFWNSLDDCSLSDLISDEMYTNIIKKTQELENLPSTIIRYH